MAEQLQQICFKSILINHEITNDPFMKRHIRPRCSPLKGQSGNAPAMPLSSSVPVHIYTHSLYSLFRLQSVTVVNINYCQRSPTTEHFITTKIPGNAYNQARSHEGERETNAPQIFCAPPNFVVPRKSFIKTYKKTKILPH